MKKLPLSVGIFLLLLSYLFLRSNPSDYLPAQAANQSFSFGPQLYLSARSPEAMRGEDLPTLTYHAQLNDGSDPYFIVSSEVEDAAEMKRLGAMTQLLEHDTTDKAYYFVDAQAEGVYPAIARLGKVLLQTTRLLLLSVSTEDELALVEALSMRGIALALLSPEPLARPDEQSLAAHLTESFAPKAGSDDAFADLLNRLTPAELTDYLGELTGEYSVMLNGSRVNLTTRYTLSKQMRSAEQHLYTLLKQMGYDTRYFAWTYGEVNGRNVIAELPGREHPERIWLIGGHFDTTSADAYTVAPGADDNGSGVAATLAIARLLRHHALRDTVRFVFFSGHQQGHWGANAYASYLRQQDEQVMGFINLDRIGYDGATKDREKDREKAGAIHGEMADGVIELHMGDMSGSKALGARFVSANQRYHQALTIEQKNQNALIFSDHEAFWRQEIPAIWLVENLYDDAARPADRSPVSHSTEDRLAHLNLNLIQRIARTVLATLLEAAGDHSASPTASQSTTRSSSVPSSAGRGSSTWNVAATSPLPTPRPQPTLQPVGCQELLINGNFESTGGWWLTSTPSSAKIITENAGGTNRVLRLGIPSNERNRLAHSSAYQAISIPNDALRLTLRYREQASTVRDLEDAREVLLLDRSFGYLRTLLSTNEPGTGEWIERTFDMRPLRGQSVYLYLNVYNNGSGGQQWSYLDDLSLTVCSPPPSSAKSSSDTTAQPTPTTTPNASRSNSSVKTLPTPIVVDLGETDYGVIPIATISVDPGEEDVGIILDPDDHGALQTAMYGFGNQIYLPIAWR